MKHILMLSGGVSSWFAGKLVAAKHGVDNLYHLFADTLIEDEDLYRFLNECSANIGGKLVRVVDGRTPWEVFHDERYIGNTRIAPCSRILKQELCRKWLEDNCNPCDTILYVGIHWSEREVYW